MIKFTFQQAMLLWLGGIIVWNWAEMGWGWLMGVV
jgi:hypothetical protein